MDVLVAIEERRAVAEGLLEGVELRPNFSPNEAAVQQPQMTGDDHFRQRTA